MRSAKEAVAYLKTLHALVRYLGISDGNMQEGSFRCDANVSIRPKGETALGTRTETKNVNSFRFVERAINYEIARQIDILESGGTIVQETRLYDADKNETRAMRSKETANDYRYFPDPDLLPLHVDAEFIEAMRKQLPELPEAKKNRFLNSYGLTPYDAGILAGDRALADYFEAAAKQVSDPAAIKLVANWIIGDLSAALNKENLEIQQSAITAEQLAQLVRRITDNTVSGKIAKTIFEALWQNPGSDVDSIIRDKGLVQITDDAAIEKTIDAVLAANSQQVADYRAGKETLFGFFVGQVMKAMQGKANPQLVNSLLQKKLT
jgi:aspartyl-tRNA(Asn)/glutamyl-tRNA(Gln) amidotransferase subunit B